MRISGITRRVDSLGRIVIPKEVRKELDINEGDPMEILQEGKNIVLKKYHVSCVFCGEKEGLFEYMGIRICKECSKKIGSSSKK
ncbi:MAG TPA: AbrB family transcriptional regulator [Clostridium sp.]|nr:AbrB family transcriptional regulator [Clostridium sp.]